MLFFKLQAPPSNRNLFRIFNYFSKHNKEFQVIYVIGNKMLAGVAWSGLNSDKVEVGGGLAETEGFNLISLTGSPTPSYTPTLSLLNKENN